MQLCGAAFLFENGTVRRESARGGLQVLHIFAPLEKVLVRWARAMLFTINGS
jgi:hypothetical protein